MAFVPCCLTAPEGNLLPIGRISYFLSFAAPLRIFRGAVSATLLGLSALLGSAVPGAPYRSAGSAVSPPDLYCKWRLFWPAGFGGFVFSGAVSATSLIPLPGVARISSLGFITILLRLPFCL